ncbi:DUF6122 family protein [Lutibacter sp.]|uniref:DUF6122 family protein n=1 Tax=Lutibacter sp. TaxID=1925666 RepID=UPI003426E3D9
MEILRFISHYGMHFLAPGVLAYLFFNEQWIKVWFIFILTMLVDVDHLIANPIFDATRCSINYHPLHSYYAIGVYLILLVPFKTRIIAIGLLFHMLTDAIDCLWI